MSPDRVAVVVMAAGGSKRLGRPKQLEDWKGTTLIARSVSTALEAGVGPVLVVLGAHAERCRAELAGLDITIVDNREWMSGVASSVRRGVEAAASRAGTGAVLLATCDQPGVSAAHLRSLAQAWHGGAAIAASAYSGTLGVPACFDRSMFEDLRRLTADTGARQLIAQAGPDTVAAVACPDCAQDVDSEGDLSG